jgi:hypothetical protein
VAAMQASEAITNEARMGGMVRVYANTNIP